MTTSGARGTGILAGFAGLEPLFRLLYGLAVAVANFAAAVVQSIAEYNATKVVVAPTPEAPKTPAKQTTKQEDLNNGKPRQNDSVTDTLL